MEESIESVIQEIRIPFPQRTARTPIPTPATAAIHEPLMTLPAPVDAVVLLDTVVLLAPAAPVLESAGGVIVGAVVVSMVVPLAVGDIESAGAVDEAPPVAVESTWLSRDSEPDDGAGAADEEEEEEDRVGNPDMITVVVGAVVVVAGTAVELNPVQQGMYEGSVGRVRVPL
jgi:hypothetical protein